MPLANFICPDQEQIAVQDCLSKCRLPDRCIVLPILREISREREWTGVPSTTQLINPTCLEFLKITKPYAVEPESRAFMLLGILTHEKLALQATTTEIPVGEEITSTIDLVDIANGGLELIDYKTWGSYRVARALGLEKSGKGFKVNPQLIDMEDTTLQLNHYKLQLESNGFKVAKLTCQVIVRDAGLKVARERGITRSMYKLNIPIMDSQTVRDYFAEKREALLLALSSGFFLNICSEKDCWEGRRCADYCDVWESCPRGLQEHRKP